MVPGSSRNRVVGRYADGVKVQVSAAPERGKANEAVADVLAEWLGVKPSQVSIVAGHSQPRKTIAVAGYSPDQLKSKLEQIA